MSNTKILDEAEIDVAKENNRKDVIGDCTNMRNSGRSRKESRPRRCIDIDEFPGIKCVLT